MKDSEKMVWAAAFALSIANGDGPNVSATDAFHAVSAARDALTKDPAPLRTPDELAMLLEMVWP